MPVPKRIVRRFVVGLAAATLWGCASPEMPANAPLEGAPRAERTLLYGACGNVGMVDPGCWSPGTTIGIVSDDAYRGEIVSAVAAWNQFLVKGRTLGIPQLLVGPIGAEALVQVVVHGAATSYCGVTSNGGTGVPSRIDLYPGEGAQCSNRSTGSLTAAVTHELSHVLGYGPDHGGGYAGTNQLTSNCTTFLQVKSGVRSIPGAVCYHEVEPVMRAYVGITLESDFFDRPIVHGVTVTPSLSDSLSVGDQLQLTTGRYQWNDPSAVAPAASWGSFSTESRNMAVATFSTAGLVTAVGAGGTWVRFVLDRGALPSGTTGWTPFFLVGDSLAVVVRTPYVPPAGPRQVTGITFDQVPVTTAGSHMATAVLSAPMAAGDSILWTLVRGNQPEGVEFLTTHYPSTGISFWVASNSSYRVTVSAALRPGGVPAAFGEVPVCTGSGGGGGNLVRATGRPGRFGTDAVEGC